ncbi:MAG TPA: PAC2 family protein [Acidimicrobiales bacterium]|nr:PAC2 family protein [Acidimicrobiales bacterium]
MALYELIEQPDLEDPLLLLALDGWIDARLAAAGAAEVLCDQLDTITVARFDTDELLDYRARRPIAHLDDGIVRGLTWPSLELRAAADEAGNELLLLVGAEPDRLWHRFTDEVVTLALDFGVRMCVGLGAYPFAAPHTKAPRIACTASTASLADTGFLRASLDFPAGVQAAIEQGCDERGVPSLGLWAQIPHYVPATMPFPAGSLALVEALARVGELSLPVGDLPSMAAATRARLDELIAQNPEHAAMLRQLELAWEQAEPVTEMPFAASDLPSGDELMAELEQFLRDQRPDS